MSERLYDIKIDPKEWGGDCPHCTATQGGEPFCRVLNDYCSINPDYIEDDDCPIRAKEIKASLRSQLSAKDKEITDLKKQLYPGDIKRSSEGTCYCAECERKAKEIEELKKMLGLWVCRLDWGPEYSSDYLFVYAQSKEEALTILKNSEIDTNAVSFTLRQIDDLKKGVLWDSRDREPPQE